MSLLWFCRLLHRTILSVKTVSRNLSQDHPTNGSRGWGLETTTGQKGRPLTTLEDPDAHHPVRLFGATPTIPTTRPGAGSSVVNKRKQTISFRLKIECGKTTRGAVENPARSRGCWRRKSRRANKQASKLPLRAR
ncbi:hypothetical protein B0J18DRAFT_424547 [Chaetomium sp. MPI-SDFR-AT-0129]|nr:hypothetical protein B0J18DRAFT_424547 [Chaetomium sp. MPI-SDFR-AT-0129]